MEAFVFMKEIFKKIKDDLNYLDNLNIITGETFYINSDIIKYIDVKCNSNEYKDEKINKDL